MDINKTHSIKQNLINCQANSNLWRNNIYETQFSIYLQVTDHKTGEYSPAMLGVNIDLYNLIRKYIALCKHVPGYYAPKPDDGIFITWSNKSNKLPGQLKNFRGMEKLCGRIMGKKINATLLRKATATAVRESRPDLREPLAEHMSHLPTTADKYYNLKKKRDSALTMSNTISKILTDDNTFQKYLLFTTVRMEIGLS